MVRRPQAPSFRRPQLRLRVLVVLVSVLACLSLLADSAHLTLTAHAVCPEHGELVHVDDVPAHPAARDARGDAPAASGEHAGDHSHDHCNAVADDEATAPASHAVRATLLQIATVALVPRGAHHAPSRKQRLLLAPKTSPPA